MHRRRLQLLEAGAYDPVEVELALS